MIGWALRGGAGCDTGRVLVGGTEESFWSIPLKVSIVDEDHGLIGKDTKLTRPLLVPSGQATLHAPYARSVMVRHGSGACWRVGVWRR